MLFLQIIGCIFFILIIYLIIIVFFPVMKEKRAPFKKNPQPLLKEPPACRENVIYYAGLDKINGWLYLPKNAKSKVPCIILNHGFGGTKDALLENYALRFCAAGYGVLAYDYRHYGDSEGHPRQIYSAGEQLDDLRMGI